MPKGKPNTGGSVAYGFELDPEAFREICENAPATSKHTKPSGNELTSVLEEIARHVASFAMHANSEFPTETEIRRKLKKIESAARQLHRCMRHTKVPIYQIRKLRQQLETCAQIRHILQSQIRRNGFEGNLYEFESLLTTLSQIVSKTDWHRQLETNVQYFTNITEWKSSGPYLPDQNLGWLVRRLIPIWVKLTGLSPRTYNSDTEDHEFASWISALSRPANQVLTEAGAKELAIVTRTKVETILKSLPVSEK
ncbi:MAG: hypothetical protein RIM72_16130 [Alphaproteobacteria bacterium]